MVPSRYADSAGAAGDDRHQREGGGVARPVAERLVDKEPPQQRIGPISVGGFGLEKISCAIRFAPLPVYVGGTGNRRLPCPEVAEYSSEMTRGGTPRGAVAANSRA